MELAVRRGEARVIALDRGPGTPELLASAVPRLRGGKGLGAVRRLSDEFAVERRPGGGLRLTALKRWPTHE